MIFLCCMCVWRSLYECMECDFVCGVDLFFFEGGWVFCVVESFGSILYGMYFGFVDGGFFGCFCCCVDFWCWVGDYG